MHNAPRARQPSPIRNIHCFELFIIGILVFSEGEIKAQQNAVAAQVRPIWRRAPLADPRVLVVEGKPCTTTHERVIAIPEHIVVDVTQIGRRPRKRLLRHANPLGSLEDRELRVPDKMGFNKSSVPGGVPGSGRQGGPVGIVVARVAGSSDDVAIAGAEPGIIRSVLRKDLEVEMRTKIEQPFESNSAKALVAGSRTRDRNATLGQVGGWG